MRDGWRELAFGDVLRKAGEHVAVDSLPSVPYAGVRLNGRGVYPRDPVDPGIVKARSLTRIHAGQVVYNRMWATRGSFGVATAAVDGCVVTNDFPVFATTPEVEPGYLALLFATPTFQSLAAASAVGTTERRRLHERDFLALRIVLPPLSEQRRIVDLIGSVEDSIARAKTVSAAAQKALSAYLDETLEQMVPENTTSVGEMATLGSGPSWRAEDEAATARNGFLPVVGITSTPAGTRIVDATQRRYVRGLPPTVRTLTEDSLLLIRTNGNRNRIGNVYRVPRAAVGHAFSAFQIAASVRVPSQTAYLFWFLSAPSVQARVSEAASGSTGLGNVSVRWLSGVEVPLPSEPERMRMVGLADALDAVDTAAARLVVQLGGLRSTLLADLLSGKHQMAVSYDRFIDPAA